MKLMAPALPKGWRSETQHDGTVRVVAPNSSLGCFGAVGASALWLLVLSWLSPAVIPPSWPPLLGFPALLCLGSLYWYAGREQVWLLSSAGLEILSSVFGCGLWRTLHSRGELSIVAGWENVWLLLLHCDGRVHRLYRSEVLADVLAFSSFLQTHLHWTEVEGAEIAPYVRQAINLALLSDSSDLICRLLDEPRTLPLLAQMWREGGSFQRPQLFTMLAQVERSTARLSRLVELGTPESQVCAIEILGALDNAEALLVLRRALENPDETVRRRAAVALGQRRDAESVPELCRVVESAPELRQAAAWALGEIRATAAVSVLADLLAASASVVEAPDRQAAAVALGKIKDVAAVHTLSRALEDRVPSVRESAVEALALIADMSGVPALIQAMGDHERAVATRAVTALGRIGHPSAVPDLCRILSNGGLDLRSRAAAALAEIGGNMAVESLCEALDDPDAGVRYQVVCALQRLAAPPAVVPLQMRAAIPLLRTLGGTLPVEATELRHAARETLRRIEEGTGSVKQLPLPATGAAPDTADLPLPAGARAKAEAADAPVTLQVERR